MITALPERTGSAVSAGDICGGMHPSRFSNSFAESLLRDARVVMLITQARRDDKTHGDKSAMR